MNNTYYDEKIETLPDNLQYAIIMSGWKESLVAIQNQFKLHIDQTQVLEDSTLKLMFGDIDAPDFIAHMFNDAHINSEMAADLLLEVDLRILKKIRGKLEAMEQKEKEDEELNNLLLDDEEKHAREESDIYADYYDEVAKIKEEVKAGMVNEGILPDGSNITDEMLGITNEIPTNIEKERGDLLSEIESPSKSFIPINKVAVEKTPEPVPVDHQLENTHIEAPYHQEEIIPAPVEQPVVQTISVSTATEPQPEPQPKSEIKKPININVTDTYREPIE